MALNNKEIRVALQTALLGEIYPSIRAIVYEYNLKNKSFLIRYYLDREPIEEDYESVSEVMTEFISQFKHSEFDKLKEECIYSNLVISELDPLNGFVYSRNENV